MDSENVELCYLSLSVASATTPGKHFAACRVVRFAEGRIGYGEWALRNGHLSDIHTIDNRYDHDVDEPTQIRASEHRSKFG
jgi:hypothetical protein